MIIQLIAVYRYRKKYLDQKCIDPCERMWLAISKPLGLLSLMGTNLVVRENSDLAGIILAILKLLV